MRKANSGRCAKTVHALCHSVRRHAITGMNINGVHMPQHDTGTRGEMSMHKVDQDATAQRHSEAPATNPLAENPFGPISDEQRKQFQMEFDDALAQASATGRFVILHHGGQVNTDGTGTGATVDEETRLKMMSANPRGDGS